MIWDKPTLRAWGHMKKLLIACLFLFIIGLTNAQNRQVDSLRSVLANTTEPARRFDLLNKIIDNIFSNGSGNIDYSSCVEMVKIAQDLKSDSLLAIAYNTVGNYFLINSADYSNALEYFFKGIPLAENANDKRRLSSLYIDIAVVYFRLNNPDEQIKYLRKASANLPDPDAPLYYFLLDQVDVYTSRYFILKKQYDSALYYVAALNEANRHYKSKVYDCSAQALLGIINEAKGDTALAHFHYSNALRATDSIQYFYIKLSVKTPYIDFLIATRKIPEALVQARELLNMGIEKNNADVKRSAAGFLRKIAEYNHQTDSAYHFAVMESSLKDSVFNQNSINKIQSLVFREQLRVIEEEGKRAAEAAKRKHNIQNALLALGILSFIILFLLLTHSFIINEKLISFLIVIALLLVFEFLNLVLHPFLETITHHNPVLMLLIMVLVAALLVPLHHKSEKWAKHTLTEKNKAIRLAAAKKLTERQKK